MASEVDAGALRDARLQAKHAARMRDRAGCSVPEIARALMVSEGRVRSLLAWAAGRGPLEAMPAPRCRLCSGSPYVARGSGGSVELRLMEHGSEDGSEEFSGDPCIQLVGRYRDSLSGTAVVAGAVPVRFCPACGRELRRRS